MSAIVMEEEMTIYRAAELRLLLADAVAGGGEIELDLSGVAEIDCSGIQLLLAARKSAQERGAVLRLSGHSPAVIEAFELLDLMAHFGDHVVIAPAAAAAQTGAVPQ